MMIIDIVGSGSLGLLYGSKLALSGNHVRFWCRDMEQVKLLRLQGLSIRESDDDVISKLVPEQFEANIIENFSEMWNKRPGQWLFLMTKQKDVVKVCHDHIAGIQNSGINYHKPPEVVCFQNGTGHLEQMHEILSGWDIYAAITTEGAKRISSYEVFHAGRGDTWIGIPGSDEASDSKLVNSKPLESRAQSIICTLQQAGFKAILSNNIDEIIYRKLLMNAVINPLTSLWRIPNGQLLASSQRIELMKDLFDEGIAVYDACGISYPSDLWDQIIAVCVSTSGNTSSMLKDVLAGTPTEVSWINGSIVTMATKVGIQAPLHQLFTQLIEGLRIEED